MVMCVFYEDYTSVSWIQILCSNLQLYAAALLTLSIKGLPWFMRKRERENKEKRKKKEEIV